MSLLPVGLFYKAIVAYTGDRAARQEFKANKNTQLSSNLVQSPEKIRDGAIILITAEKPTKGVINEKKEP